MTLLEMMVALLISSLVILGVVNIYRFATNNWNDGMRVEQLQQQTQYAMSQLERDVRQAVVTTVLVAGVTTDQAPISTTDNGQGTTGYGVIIIENISTVGIATLDQVNYRLITTKGVLQLQRSHVGTYNAGDLVPLSSNGLVWSPVMNDGYYVTTLSTTPPFTVSAFDITTYVNQDLAIALMAQTPKNAPNTLTTYMVPLISTWTVRGNGQVQYQAEGGQ
jgi:competence protein ComGC